MDPNRKTPPAPMPAVPAAKPPARVPAIRTSTPPFGEDTEVKKHKLWAALLLKLLAPIATAAAAFIASSVQHEAGQDKQEKIADVAYKTLAAPTNDHGKKIQALEDAVIRLTKTLELHEKVLLATQPGFTPTGTPAPVPETPAQRKRPPRRAAAASPKLVKEVQANAAKNLQEIKQRVVPSPTLAPVPESIPKEPPPQPQAPPTQ